MLSLLHRAADIAVKTAAFVVLLALLATVVLGVVARVLNDPLVWSDELARYLMVWLALIGWTMASRRRSHIRITLILDRLPAWIRRSVEVVIQAVVALFGLLLVRDGFVLVSRNLDIESVSLPVSSAVVYVPIVLAGAATLLQALVQILEQAIPSVRRQSFGIAGGKPL
jgi:TRAP-type C4-dicarboxylate transport system permease small subunit